MSIAVPPNINETQHGVVASDKLNSKLCRDIINLSKVDYIFCNNKVFRIMT